ncbi:MAG: hypothetical protein HOF69_04205 [Campylobacteraceae bacterium]|jgi:hypothetical protein|nr:hypothetical protein [Campylobacteraceae bacterium]MBT3882447.1 hypothetical protein [Campylobacteraceae bacterium]MBT4178923.1 hypothetical protein [Campylobacteraceae bacterium]MBT4708016.1 hypothetical protein [Campylobacteraceae bacterium]MBT5323436.1 hypothetical protein [Campylobacteraceae bacterium]
MSDKIDEIIQQISSLEDELLDEFQKKEKEFLNKIENEKVDIKKNVISSIEYLSTFSLITIISLPFIWMMIFPIIIIDIFVTIYQLVCFPLYKIPKVKRKDYVIMDRHTLFYLDKFQKVNCWYCEYFNGVVSYVREIAARTEQFWCPIKHSKPLKDRHSRYNNFFDYGDYKQYKKELEKRRSDFKDIK